ncbi:MAG: dihydroxy-acid dehydratase [Caldilineaceae bacterium]|nr:dihydroxy-acid dehydratase [Caldilineaceae bacterium]
MSETQLRSHQWFGRHDLMGFTSRSWMKNQGHAEHLFDGRPVIGICNTWSELTPCNGHFRILAEQVKKGVYEAGGFPVEFPVMSLGEALMRPTTMLFRNLASMDVEETLRANPVDGVILLTGCDKTTPATVMGACSVDLPTLVVSGGPMLNGKWGNQDIGSGTHSYRFTDDLRAGAMSLEQYMEAEACQSRSEGHCMTMGTASTMACMVEALGLTLPSNAAIPAVDARRKRLAHMAGSRIVEMVHEDLRLSKVLQRENFENAIRINGAIGGSTNFVIHLLAIAGRLNIPLDMDDFDRLGSRMPLLVNLMPSGEYLMEDFYYAGGLPVVIEALRDMLHMDALTVTGRTLGENVAGAVCHNPKVIGTPDNPVQPEAGLAVLRGNLCPDGAIIKPSAASPHLLRHTGTAVVFEDIDDYHDRIDSPDLEADEDSILVLKNVGPKGYPGMAEVGNMGLPVRLLRKGVRDLVRISDGRMSGTAFGTVVLHVTPEAAAGGALALVENGDRIILDVPGRSLTLDVPDAELAARRSHWTPLPAHTERGYVSLYTSHVQQANLGADFDFLRGGSGSPVPRDSH